MSEITIHHRIYNNISKIIPDLETHLAQGTTSGKSVSEPFSDLYYDYLRKDGEAHIVAFAHYFESNGDRVPDPDMEVRIETEQKTAEALTFQNQFTYDQVYPDGDRNHYSPRMKQDMNEFLEQWMKNARMQEHHIVLNARTVERETTKEPEQVQKEEASKEPTPSGELAALRSTDNHQDKSKGITR